MVIINVARARISIVIFTTYIIEAYPVHTGILLVQIILSHIIDIETRLIFNILPNLGIQSNICQQTVALQIIVIHVGHPVGVVQILVIPVPSLNRLSDQFGITFLRIAHDIVGHRTEVFIVMLEITHIDIGRSTVQSIESAQCLTHDRSVIGLLMYPVKARVDIDTLVEQRERLLEHHVITGKLIVRYQSRLIGIIIRKISSEVFRTATQRNAVGRSHAFVEKVFYGIACRIHQIRGRSHLVGRTCTDLRTPRRPLVSATDTTNLLGTRIHGYRLDRRGARHIHLDRTRSTRFGRDNDHTVIGCATVKSCGIRAFQNRHVIDIFGVDRRQEVIAATSAAEYHVIGRLRTHTVLHRYTVDNDQRLIGSENRSGTAKHNFRSSTARSRIIGNDSKTSTLSLQRVNEVIILDTGHFLVLNSLGSIGKRFGFPRYTHRRYYDFL